MPIELRKAHIANDKAVMAAYGFSLKMSEDKNILFILQWDCYRCSKKRGYYIL